MEDGTSLRCREDQCREVKRCRDCGVAPGRIHHYWCRYYPESDVSYTKQSDDGDYRIFL